MSDSKTKLAAGALTQGHFGKGSSKLVSQDPTEPTDMTIPLDQLDPFDKNPRFTRNKRFEEIKDSILKTRQRDRIPVTRRPGAPRYVIAEGGNTRYAILTELSQEHPDVDRFRNALCTFVPYRGEAALIAAHLSENDQRSDLTFYERAVGIMNAKAALEEEVGHPLNQTELVEALAEEGYKVPQQHIGIMVFATTVLGDNLEQAFTAGLGRPTVTEIRSYYKGWIDWWEWRELGSAAMATETFGQIVATVDQPSFDVSLLRTRLDENASQYADCSIMNAALELGSFLGELGGARPEGDTYSKAMALKEQVAEDQAQNHTPDTGHSPYLDASDYQDDIPDPDDFDLTQEEDSFNQEHSDFEQNPQSTDDSTPAFPPEHRRDSSIEPPPAADTPRLPMDVKTLRGRIYTLAHKIANHHGIAQLIHPTSSLGLGFVIDFPTSLEDSAQITPEGHAAWWLLVSVSEQFWAPPERVIDLLPVEWRQRPIALAVHDSDRPHTLSNYCQQNAQILFGPALMPGLMSQATATGQRDGKDTKDLLNAYREITGLDQDLWRLRP